MYVAVEQFYEEMLVKTGGYTESCVGGGSIEKWALYYSHQNN
jgi:hypothetical protein